LLAVNIVGNPVKAVVEAISYVNGVGNQEMLIVFEERGYGRRM
jgi:hypothetical protein